VVPFQRTKLLGRANSGGTQARERSAAQLTARAEAELKQTLACSACRIHPRRLPGCAHCQLHSRRLIEAVEDQQQGPLQPSPPLSLLFLPVDQMACRAKVVGQVERVDGESLSYAEFVRRFMAPNRPVVLTGLTSSWRAHKDWTLSGSGDLRRPNLGFFTQNFPSSLVQVSPHPC
jgi:hypothetical protein